MIKTHSKSRMIHFHSKSYTARELLYLDSESEWIVLQLHPVEHETHDFIAEIVKTSEFNDFDNYEVEKFR